MNISPEIAEIVGGVDFDPDALHARYMAERGRRVRPDGATPSMSEVKGSSTPVTSTTLTSSPGSPASRCPTRSRLHDHRRWLRRPADGRAPDREAGVERFRVVEAAGDFGGTWYWNRYPGAMCDVESYCYLPLLEELGYMPRHKYSFAPEILEHSRNIARRFRLYDDALMQTSVTALAWDETEGLWTVRTDRGDAFRTRYVAMANGPLSRPKLPGIPGIDAFEGHTFHTSRWDYRYTGGDSYGNLSGLEGQAGRRHRHRRDGRPVHPAPGRGRPAALRLPAHAVVRRRAQQCARPIRPGPRRCSRDGSKGGWTISTPWSAAATPRRTSSATAGPTSSAT